MISLIAAMDKNQVIGFNGKLPWNLPADLKFFYQTTIGRPIIMGRKTFQFIGHPLLQRENIIVSRTLGLKERPGVVIKRSVHNALSYARRKYSRKEIFIIGGESIFRQTIDIASHLYITFIDGEFRGDTYFPNIDLKVWRLREKKARKADQRNPYGLVFTVFERKI